MAESSTGKPPQAHTAILVAAITGTLPQITSETLRARVGPFVGAIRALPPPERSAVRSAIRATYARDVGTFAYVADLARTFDVDVREIWAVDQPFLERFTSDGLRFVAQECGLVAHRGEKAFARLLRQEDRPDRRHAQADRLRLGRRLPSAMPHRLPPDPPSSLRKDPLVMLIASLFPLSGRYSLTLDLVAGPDETVIRRVVADDALGIFKPAHLLTI